MLSDIISRASNTISAVLQAPASESTLRINAGRQKAGVLPASLSCVAIAQEELSAFEDSEAKLRQPELAPTPDARVGHSRGGSASRAQRALARRQLHQHDDDVKEIDK